MQYSPQPYSPTSKARLYFFPITNKKCLFEYSSVRLLVVWTLRVAVYTLELQYFTKHLFIALSSAAICPSWAPHWDLHPRFSLLPQKHSCISLTPTNKATFRGVSSLQFNSPKTTMCRKCSQTWHMAAERTAWCSSTRPHIACHRPLCGLRKSKMH